MKTLIVVSGETGALGYFLNKFFLMWGTDVFVQFLKFYELTLIKKFQRSAKNYSVKHPAAREKSKTLVIRQ